MNISKQDQRYLIAALQLLMGGVREDIETNHRLLDDRLWKPEVRDLIQQDLKYGLDRKREVQDLLNRVRNKVIQ